MIEYFYCRFMEDDMKSPCCYIISLALIVIIGLQIQILKVVKKSLQYRAVTYTTPTTSPDSNEVKTSPLPALSPSPAAVAQDDPKLLYEVGNPAGCSYTDTAKFTLDADHQITKLQTWYSWVTGESTLSYKVKQGDTIIREGTLVRKSCDPYQGQWCQAIDESVNMALSKGEYSLVAGNAKICQNSASKGQGFIYVYGK